MPSLHVFQWIGVRAARFEPAKADCHRCQSQRRQRKPLHPSRSCCCPWRWNRGGWFKKSAGCRVVLDFPNFRYRGRAGHILCRFGTLSGRDAPQPAARRRDSHRKATATMDCPARSAAAFRWTQNKETRIVFGRSANNHIEGGVS